MKTVVVLLLMLLPIIGCNGQLDTVPEPTVPEPTAPDNHMTNNQLVFRYMLIVDHGVDFGMDDVLEIAKRHEVVVEKRENDLLPERMHSLIIYSDTRSQADSFAREVASVPGIHLQDNEPKRAIR